MAEAAVADKVDDDVLVELVTVVECETRHEQHGFGVVAIDVEDRGLDHLADIGAVGRRARVKRIAGRKADLVVDDDMHGAAGRETACLGELQRLHDNTLSGECRVAMNENRHDLLAMHVLAPDLSRPDGSLDDRTDNLEMRWIEAKRDVDRFATCRNV